MPGRRIGGGPTDPVTTGYPLQVSTLQCTCRRKCDMLAVKVQYQRVELYHTRVSVWPTFLDRNTCHIFIQFDVIHLTMFTWAYISALFHTW
jgi:hypothetical protein